MNKWLARLQSLEEPAFLESPHGGHCRNRQKALVSALAGAGPVAADELASAPCGVNRQCLEARRERLLRWGMPWREATAMAQRLAARDAELDDRVTCLADCVHYRPGRCGNHRRALLDSPEVGPDLAALLQRCPGVGRWDQLGAAPWRAEGAQDLARRPDKT